MTTDAEREANIALVRCAVEEIINRGNLSVADEAFAPEDAPGFKQSVATLRAAFPDWQFTIEEAFAVDDKVILRATVRGTHTGAPYRGKPASGKEATMGGLDIIRIADGKIVEKQGQYDCLSLLQQLGIVPTDAELVAAHARAGDTSA